jgi:catechol-2,3-dioxygenase
MAIRGLNHAVLWVRNAHQAATFYQDVLGFVAVHETPTSVFLRAPESTNDHDLGLFQAGDPTGPTPGVGLYHLAWEVPTLADLQTYATKLAEAGALVGATDHGTTKGLYAKDPDGLEFEVCWLVPHDLIDDEARTQHGELDIAAEIARYGEHTLGASARIGVPPDTVR